MATPVFICGAECGIVGVGTLGVGVEHWASADAAWSLETTKIRPGGGLRSYKCNPAAAASNHQHTLAASIGAPATLVVRFAVMFDVLPAADYIIFADIGPAASSTLTITSAGVLKATNPVGTSTGPTITLGQWYVIDMKIVEAATRTLDWRVDGVAKTQLSGAGANEAVSAFKFGQNGAATCTWYVDDICISATSGDYPLPKGTVFGLYPNGDDSAGHVYNAAADFGKAGTAKTSLNATSSLETTSWQSLKNPLSLTIDTTKFISDQAGAVTEFLSWNFDDLPAGSGAITGLMVVTTNHADTATACTITGRINDGGTTSDVYTLADFSEITIVTAIKVYATAPSSSAAWTVAKVNALKFQWGLSNDVSPDPILDGVCFEVDVAADATIALTTATPTVAVQAPTAPASEPVDTATPTVNAQTQRGAVVEAPDTLTPTVLAQAPTVSAGGVPKLPGAHWRGVLIPQADAANSWIDTPDKPALRLTGAIDVRTKQSVDWGTPTMLDIGKYVEAGDLRSWFAAVRASPRLMAFSHSTNGTTRTRTSATADGWTTFADGSPHHLRYVFIPNDGAGNYTVKFYTSEDGTAWTQVGSTVVTAGAVVLAQGAAPLAVGFGNYASSVALPGYGILHSLEVRDGEGGTVVASLDCETDTFVGGQLTDAQGNVWTLHGTAEQIPRGIEVLAQPGTAGAAEALDTVAAAVTSNAPVFGASEAPDVVPVVFTVNEETPPVPADATGNVTDFPVVVNAQQAAAGIAEAGDTVAVVVSAQQAAALAAGALTALVLALVAQQGQMGAAETLDTAAFAVQVVDQAGAVVETLDGAPLTVLAQLLAVSAAGTLDERLVTILAQQPAFGASEALDGLALTVTPNPLAVSASGELAAAVVVFNLNVVSAGGSAATDVATVALDVVAQQLAAGITAAGGSAALAVAAQALGGSVAESPDTTVVVVFNLSALTGASDATGTPSTVLLEVLAQQLAAAASANATPGTVVIAVHPEVLAAGAAGTLQADLVQFVAGVLNGIAGEVIGGGGVVVVVVPVGGVTARVAGPGGGTSTVRGGAGVTAAVRSL